MDKENKFKNLERIDLWISNADTKISYLLAFIGIIITIILTNSSVLLKIRSYIQNIMEIDKKVIISIFSLLIIALIIALTILIVRCIYYLLKASRARINISNVNSNSTLFFGTIATNTLENFREKLKSQTDEEIEEDIIEQIYINSKICNIKFDNYNKAISNLKISLIIFAAIIIIMIII